MTLADFTNEALMVPELRGRDAASAIQELCQSLQRENRISDLLPFFQTALNREFMVSSAVEAGMAFPHARVPSLREVCFALGRSSEEMPWGQGSLASVRLIFLAAVPATDSTRFLALSSGWGRLAHSPKLVARLQSARSASEMIGILRQVRLRSNGPETSAKEGMA